MMGRTFRRLGRRNRFLKQRRERMPSIRAVETTFDEITRQTLSPVRRSISPSAIRMESQKSNYDDNAMIEDNDDNVQVYDCDDVDPHDKREYKSMNYNNNKNIVSDNDIEHELNPILNDVPESQYNTPDSQETPTCSSWATALEQQVREAELEYEKTAFVEESVPTLDKSSKTFGKFVSIKELGKIY